MTECVSGIWYHGTIFNTSSFSFFTHLGSADAAKRALLKQIFNYCIHPKNSMPWHDLDVARPRLLKLTVPAMRTRRTTLDPLSSTTLRYAMILDDLTHSSDEEEWQNLSDKNTADLNRIKVERPDLSNFDLFHARRNLHMRHLYHCKDEIASRYKSHGIDAFLYPNEVEDNGQDSLCVIDGGVLQIAEEAHLSFEDIASFIPGSCYEALGSRDFEADFQYVFQSSV